ncbi:MAG: hypothetical protein WAN74_04885 [Thermoplasmata archaeon]
MTENVDWLRARGIGRERFAGYVVEYLATLGYTVERSETTEPMESHLTAHLNRMDPSIPPSASDLRFRLYPTSGGAALIWEAPRAVAAEDRAGMDRFVREIALHLERSVATESHATAKVVRPAESRLPWVVSSPAPP